MSALRSVDLATRWPCRQEVLPLAHQVSAGERWTESYFGSRSVGFTSRLTACAWRTSGACWCTYQGAGAKAGCGALQPRRRACELIGETIGAVRAFGGEKLVWHTGEDMSPPLMG